MPSRKKIESKTDDEQLLRELCKTAVMLRQCADVRSNSG